MKTVSGMTDDTLSSDGRRPPSSGADPGTGRRGLLEGLLFSRDEIRDLYAGEGWTEYVRDMDGLWTGIGASLLALGAYEDDRLVGFCRLVGDGRTVVLVQDLIVERARRGRGIGSALLGHALAKYAKVRQRFVVCDSEPALLDFYKRNGFSPLSDHGETCLAR